MRFAFVGLMSVVVANLSGAQNLTASADSVMKAAEKDGFSGVVRLEKDGRVVLEKGYGLAIRKPAVRFTPSTVVQIGSNTKDFTAVAILQLQERGRLSIHDPLGKFFPSAPADNSGDSKTLLAFITDHFANGPSDPKPEERIARIGGMHQNLGDITVDGMYDTGEGPVQVVIKTKNEGAGTLIVDIDRAAPYRIKRMGVQIGGD